MSKSRTIHFAELCLELRLLDDGRHERGGGGPREAALAVEDDRRGAAVALQQPHQRVEGVLARGVVQVDRHALVLQLGLLLGGLTEHLAATEGSSYWETNFPFRNYPNFL